jgi:Rrf2 family protein
MPLSQRCLYAFRAVFELARHYGGGPVKAATVAERQDIPARFLEAILNQLKRGGFVESVRGRAGGYRLARPPAAIAVGEVLRFVEGPLLPVSCMEESSPPECSLREECVFMPMWRQAHEAMMEVYDSTTFEDLVEEHRERMETAVPSYSI